MLPPAVLSLDLFSFFSVSNSMLDNIELQSLYSSFYMFWKNIRSTFKDSVVDDKSAPSKMSTVRVITFVSYS